MYNPHCDSNTQTKTTTSRTHTSPTTKKRRTESTNTALGTDPSREASQSPGEMRFGMQYVAARITFEKERVQAEREQNYARAFRLSLFDEVVRHASAMPRPVLSANDARYVSFLSRGICEHKLKTEYPIFKGMLADIEARFLEKSAAIVIRPDELTSKSSHRVECHVIFASARDFLSGSGLRLT